MKEIVIWGGTGQAIVLEEILRSAGFSVSALFDNDPAVESPFENIPIYHQQSGFEKWLDKKEPGNCHFIVAIGGDSGMARILIHDMLKNKGLKPISAVHNTAYLSPSAVMGEGCQILANSSVCARTIMGSSVIVNTSASIDHECVVGKGVHIGPGASIAGCVHIRDFSFIGTGAVVLPRKNIGKNTIIGAGSVVTKDIPDNVIAYGNPAKIIRKNDR